MFLNQTGARAASFLHYLKSVLMQRASQKLSCSNQCLQWYCVIQTLQINRKRGKPPFYFPLPEHTHTRNCTLTIFIMYCFINLYRVRKNKYLWSKETSCCIGDDSLEYNTVDQFSFLFVKLHSGMTNSGHCKGCKGC